MKPQTVSTPAPPHQVLSRDAWTAAREKFLEKEKAHTRQRDALNAERRQLPWVKIDKEYVFDGPDGKASLLDLFEGRRQLIIHHFMFGPEWQQGCAGCSMLVDNMGHAAHLHARDTSRALISRAPLEKLNAFKARMGWSIPWYSSYASDFNYDFGRTVDENERFGISVFIRDGEDIYQSYFTSQRGVEYLGSNWSYLDLTPFGRQETWEDAPADVPQTPPHQWVRLHDSYDTEQP